MRIIITISICLLQAVGIFAQDREFTINGKFPTSYYDGLKVYLNEIDYANSNKVQAKDSTTIKGDKFAFKGVTEKSIAVRYITLADNQEITALVVIEEGNIEIEMSDVPQMNGTVKNDELSTFTNNQIKSRESLEILLEKAQTLHKDGTLDDEMSTELETKFNEQKRHMQQEVYDYVSKNILNELGEFFFTIYASGFRVPQIEMVYASSTKEFQESFIVRSLMNQHVWGLGDLREGQKMKGMEMKDAEGKIENIALHFDKGKVVLLDFWASWCGPCIKTMPIIVKLYDRYRDSGFEIVGISLDEDETSWKAAIKRLGMEWPQYIDDGGGWKGAVAQEYKISRIPQTYLLDREGKIAGHDLSGTALINRIEELLKEE